MDSSMVIFTLVVFFIGPKDIGSLFKRCNLILMLLMVWQALSGRRDERVSQQESEERGEIKEERSATLLL